jgi:hypothetical protein
MQSQHPKTALIISHPGHELRVHHWLERARPMVLVLTDGSGSVNQSRLQSTSQVLNATGASPGPIYGRFSDAELYAQVMNGNGGALGETLEEIAAVLEQEKVETVVGDAIEGYNPSHDLCRYLIGAAVERVERRTGRTLRNYDFPLVGRPDVCPPGIENRAIWVDLDESALERKLAASRGYPELSVEVDATLRSLGKAVFQKECLRPVANDAGLHDLPEEPPFYERHGEKRVQEGIYSQVIRYREHLRPLAEALWHRAVCTP